MRWRHEPSKGPFHISGGVIQHKRRRAVSTQPVVLIEGLVHGVCSPDVLRCGAREEKDGLDGLREMRRPCIEVEDELVVSAVEALLLQHRLIELVSPPLAAAVAKGAARQLAPGSRAAVVPFFSSPIPQPSPHRARIGAVAALEANRDRIDHEASQARVPQPGELSVGDRARKARLAAVIGEMIAPVRWLAWQPQARLLGRGAPVVCVELSEEDSGGDAIRARSSNTPALI